MNKDNNNSNLMAFVLLSALVLIGFQYFYVKPNQQKLVVQTANGKVTTTAPLNASIPPSPDALRERADVIKDNPRLAITTSEIKGSLNLKGARFDDIQLTSYRVTVDPASQPVTLLSPRGVLLPYNTCYAELGWLSDQADLSLPNDDTMWSTKDTAITPDHPARLTWNNGKGLQFERTIAVDEHFFFTVTDRVTNTGANAVTLYPFGVVAHRGNPVVKPSTVLHEGPIGVIGGTLVDATYKKLIEHGKYSYDGEGGWLGITDKYWLVSLIPGKNEQMTATFAYNPADPQNPADAANSYFQTHYRAAVISIASHATSEHVTRLFTGAKRFDTLSNYGEKQDIPLFNRAIDFGWFWFLTIPFLQLLSLLGHQLGSYGLAILVFTVMLKLITLPLSLKSSHSMARMKEMQPELTKLKERYADDKVKQNQEMMELFKREKINPMSGCVPTLIQIPIFFALYKVLYVGIELRQTPFYGWIKDMSLPDPTSVLNLFGLLQFNLPPSLHIGFWPLMMGIGMYAQQRMMPQPTADKSQARMMMTLPFIFTYMMASAPAGLVIYWTWSNLLGILQQGYIQRVDAKRRARKASLTEK